LRECKAQSRREEVGDANHNSESDRTDPKQYEVAQVVGELHWLDLQHMPQKNSKSANLDQWNPTHAGKDWKGQWLLM
jgi:hypothetical protein